MISFSGVEKKRGKKYTFKADCQIRKGEVTAILGKNGAGKSTLLSLCAGLLRPDSGSITVNGPDSWKDKYRLNHIVAYMPDLGQFEGFRTVKSILSLYKACHPGWNGDRAIRLPEGSGIDENDKLKTLSRGMRVKFHRLLVLSINAEVILLDEPTLGLDYPFRRKLISTLFRELQGSEKTILISSNQIEETESLYENVLILNNGQISFSGTVEDFTGNYRIIEGPEKLQQEPGYVFV